MKEILLSLVLVKLKAFLCYLCVFFEVTCLSFLYCWMNISEWLLGLYSLETRLIHFFLGWLATIYWSISHLLSLPIQLKKHPSLIPIILFLNKVNPILNTLNIWLIYSSRLFLIPHILFYDMIIECIDIILLYIK